jgi:hypothetical protein
VTGLGGNWGEFLFTLRGGIAGHRPNVPVAGDPCACTYLSGLQSPWHWSREA